MTDDVSSSLSLFGSNTTSLLSIVTLPCLKGRTLNYYSHAFSLVRNLGIYEHMNYMFESPCEKEHRNASRMAFKQDLACKIFLTITSFANLLFPFFDLNEDFLGLSKLVSITLILFAEVSQLSSPSVSISSASSTEKLNEPPLVLAYKTLF